MAQKNRKQKIKNLPFWRIKQTWDSRKRPARLVVIVTPRFYAATPAVRKAQKVKLKREMGKWSKAWLNELK